MICSKKIEHELLSIMNFLLTIFDSMKSVLLMSKNFTFFSFFLKLIEILLTSQKKYKFFFLSSKR